MFQRLLVPLDGSPGAEQAIPLAARLARSAAGSILFLHVISPFPVMEKEDTAERFSDTARLVEREAQALLEASAYLTSVPAMYAAELEGVSTEMEVAYGLTSSLLTLTARLQQRDLVVMCSHREAGLGQWGDASVAWQAIHQQIGALLIVKERGIKLQPDQLHSLRAIVPLDGSLFAEMALGAASRLLAQLSYFGELPSEIHLVRVVAARGVEYEQAEDYLQAMTNRLTTHHRRKEAPLITSSVIVGEEVAEALLAQVHTTGCAPFIAMATHCREGMPRVMWGNVAERVLDAATCPLLIIQPAGPTRWSSLPLQHLTTSH